MFKITEKSNIYNNRLEYLYTRLSKIFLVISIFFILLIIIVTIGIFLLDMNQDWAFLSLANWVLFCISIIGIFIILNVFFYIHYFFDINKRIEFEESKQEFIHGKRLFVYTCPSNTKGGIFSKTYIQIDEKNVMRLRNLMIPPDELWNKNE